MSYYICTEGFAVTLYDSLEEEAEAQRMGAMPQLEIDRLREKGERMPKGEDVWFRAGQRVHDSHRVFAGVAGANRKRKMFLPESEEPEKRGPGRPRKVEVMS